MITAFWNIRYRWINLTSSFKKSSESCCRGPHSTKASSLHPTPRHRHPTHKWTCSPSSRDFTPCTLQNTKISKTEGQTSLKHYALSDMHQIDSFQDPKSDLYGKTSQIDSFHDPYIFAPKLTPFKTLTFCTLIDSLQDPVQWTIWNITQLTPFKTLTLDYTVFSISMGDFLQLDNTKSPWETSFRIIFHQNPLHTVKFELILLKSGRWYITPNYLTHFKTLRKHILHCTRWFSSKVTPFKTLTQDKDTVTTHLTAMYIHISDSKLLKSTFHPLRTYSRLLKSI